ncbi:MAG: hypothetical protein ACFFDN_35865 [Candidatus Hodarchaeota archaeon]
MINSSILADNWGLELSAVELQRLTDGIFKNDKRHDYLHSIKTKTTDVSIQSVLQLIEWLVLYDSVSYLDNYSGSWKRLAEEVFPGIGPFFIENHIPNELHEKLSGKADYLAYNIENKEPVSLVVSSGSFYYLFASQHLGLPYHPCPIRANFMSGIFQNEPNFKESSLGRQINFREELLMLFDKESKEMIKQIHEQSKMSVFEIEIPTLSNYVLGNVTRPEEIVPATIEIRNSSKCRAFREWLCFLDECLARGDAYSFSREMKAVKGIINDLEMSLGLRARNSEKGRLIISLVPSLDIPLDWFKTLFNKKKKPHMLFIQEVMEKSIQDRNYSQNLELIFGYNKA